MPKPTDTQMTAARAGEILGKTPQQIYAMTAQGKLERVPVDGKILLVTAASVRAAKRAATKGE